MASSAVLQSTVTRPVPLLMNKAVSYQIIAPSYCSLPRSQRSASLRVRCNAEDGQKEEIPSPAAAPIPPPQPRPPSQPKMSTKFGDVLAFNGPAPERINGRLAMIGFASALLVELNNGQDVITQITNGGTTWFIGTSVVLTLASLIPFFKGVSVQRVSDGIMTPDAEMWNGRLAMLGLVALAVTEYVKDCC